MVKLLAVLIGGAIGLAIGGMVAMGLNLGIVYLYMWLMNGVLHIPYVPASSTLFAMFSFGAILLSVTTISCNISSTKGWRLIPLMKYYPP